jgi:hypothetical protein
MYLIKINKIFWTDRWEIGIQCSVNEASKKVGENSELIAKKVEESSELIVNKVGESADTIMTNYRNAIFVLKTGIITSTCFLLITSVYFRRVLYDRSLWMFRSFQTGDNRRSFTPY